MKYFLKPLLIAAAFVFLSQSCINKDYDLDNIDTSGVFHIPPIMLGNIEIIFLEELPYGVLPPGAAIPAFKTVRSYVFRDFFNENVIDRFFFVGARAVEITTEAVVNLPVSDVFIDLHFNVLDNNGNPINAINMDSRRLEKGVNEDVSVRIEERYMVYMSGARDFEFVLVISNEQNAVLIDDESTLQLNQMIVRTGGIQFNF